MKNRAFTLIELLVVVLIIGILSAIALPQYQVSVDKAHFSNLRTIGASFIQAAQAYRLENGTWPADFSSLAVDMPGGFERVTATASGRNYECAKNEDIYCCMVPNKDTFAAMIACGKLDESFAYQYSLSNKKHYCLADPDDSRALRLCKAVSGKTTAYITTWRLYSPTGYDKVMHYYTLD